MYDYFEGTVVEKGPASVVLDLGGIGYRFQISLESSERLKIGERARVFCHLHARESEVRLFGFASRDERAMFQLLLTVSGVGPALALKLLSGCPAPKLRSAIRSGDVDRLKGIRGVGTRTAQRILVDLSEAVGALDGAGGGGEGDDEGSKRREDALLALVALGYSRPAAEGALRRALEESRDGNVQDLVRRSLRFL